MLNVLPFESWSSQDNKLSPINISDLSIIWQVGFQQLGPEYGQKIINKMKMQWGIEDFASGAAILSMPLSVPAEYQEREADASFDHSKIQRLLAEAGKVQHYFSETEYKLPVGNSDKRLDVVWKRELQGVPTYVFEVELSHSIEKAIAKLKVAFNLWNAKPRLITLSGDIDKANAYIKSEDKNFKKEFFCFEPRGVDEILGAKQKLRDVESMYKIW